MTLNPITDEPQFRECPACGNPIPVSSADCPHCGAQRIGPDPIPPEATREYRFLRALFTRSNHFTMVFVVNLAIEAVVGQRVGAKVELEGLDVPEMGQVGYPEFELKSSGVRA